MFSFLSKPENNSNNQEYIPKSTLGYGANSLYPGFPVYFMDYIPPNIFISFITYS
jgi:hypothetical protein